MTRPSRPSVARNAKASGTPAKFEATPEKVMASERIHDGSPPRATASASSRPTSTPMPADAAETLMEMAVGVDDRRLGELDEIGEREVARLVEEGAGDEVERRHDQEQKGEDQEGQDAQQAAGLKPHQASGETGGTADRPGRSRAGRFAGDPGDVSATGHSLRRPNPNS